MQIKITGYSPVSIEYSKRDWNTDSMDFDSIKFDSMKNTNGTESGASDVTALCCGDHLRSRDS